jgi:zinc protease
VLVPERVHRYRLSNGLTVLVAPDDRVPVVAIVTWVKAGYFDEPDDVVGVSHVLEHMYFKGTPTRGVGEIARQTKGQGGFLNAGTIYDHTSYYTVLPSSGFETGLEIQADAFANSLIDAGELAREIEVIVEEAKRKADSPNAVASETLFELLHDRHRMRRWRIGREPGLRSLTREHVHGFYRRFYQPANTVLAIAGDVDVDAAIRHAERLYGGLTNSTFERDRGPAEPARRDFRVREWSGDIAQAELAMGWRAPPLRHPDTPLLEVAASVLSAGRASRLYRAVRERQLASSISAYLYTPVDVGVFVVHATGRPERLREGAAAAWQQLARVRDGEVTNAELDRVRQVIDAGWMRRLETMEGRANHLAAWESLGDWQMAGDFLEAMQSATPQRLAEVASRHLDPDSAAIVIYRPAGSAEISTDAESLRAALDGASGPDLSPSRAVPAAHIAPVSVRRERTVSGVQVFRTAHGVPVLVQRAPRTPIAYAGVFVRAGAAFEPAGRLGVSTLMTRTSLKGTTTRDAARLAEEGERLGATLGASAGTEMLQWTSSVPVAQLEGALALLADVVQAPTMPADALESERAVALSQLAQRRDDMYHYPLQLAAEVAWGDHPYARTPLGTAAALDSLQPDDLRAWHREAVLDGEQVIAIVGDAEPELMAALAAGAFDALRPVPRAPLSAPEWQPSLAPRTESRDKAQTAIALAFPAPSRREAARFAASLLGGVASGLGGRFFEALRDRQSLAYTVLVKPMARPLAGQFVAYIATSPEKEEQARRGLLAEVARLHEEPVTPEELERARTHALGAHAIRRENGGAVMGDMAESWLFGRIEELDEIESILRAVTLDDVHDVALRCFSPLRFAEGAVRGVSGRQV